MKKFFTSWWTLSIGTILLCVLLFAVGLPIFVDWMKPLWVRLVFVGLFVALWILWFFLRRRKAKRAEAALAAELAGPDRIDEESGAVQKRMAEALEQLRKVSGKDRNYLYSRPWYVIIGPPGAGKTTALVNSGLRFPFSDQALGGTGGTRNLDFMFADEAVLVDTAGRYTTQDSDSRIDNAGWRRLLELLRKHRPFEPVNGIFVAIPADDLQRGDVRVVDEHAAIIRRRLREIREELQVELPVYLIITKADMLAGFSEYFGDLDVEGRRAVFGHTFEWNRGRQTPGDVTAAFDSIANSISARTPKRLEEEQDIRRRGMILGFASQLHALRPAVYRLIEGAFLNEDRPSGRLRGFYLTSGTQDGSAIDRILQGTTQAFGGQAAVGRQEGKAYFLNRLLQEVAFGEAGLPVADAAVLRKRRGQLTAIVASVATVAVLLIGAWTFSFIGNRGFQSDTAEAADKIIRERDATRVDLVRVGENDTPLDQLLPLLNQLRNLPQGYAAQQAGGPSLWLRFGLFQSSLAKANEQAYLNGLRRILLPRLLLRLEDKMRQEMDNPNALYEPLKAYQMLGGRAPEGKFDAASVQRYIERDWAAEVYPGPENRQIRTELAAHLRALTGDPGAQLAWKDRIAPLDKALVQAARTSVGTTGLAPRAYAIMREKAVDPENDWHMPLQAGEAAAFANPNAVMALSVPAFFTPGGFTKSYSARLLTIQADLENELWVMGEDGQTSTIRRELGSLKPAIAAAYAREYIDHWQGVIDTLQPADYFNDPQAFRAFTRAPSPLKTVLMEVRANTTFEGGVAGELGKMAKTRADQNRVLRTAGKLAGAAGDRGMSADAEIAMHFAEVNAWVGDGKEAGGVDEFITLVQDTFARVAEFRGPGSSAASGDKVAEILAELQTKALLVPDLVQTFAQSVAGGGNNAQVKIRQEGAALAYTESVLPACLAAVDGKYPFDGGSGTDADVTAVREAFGSGGKVASFIDTTLNGYLDRNGDYWRWNEGDPIAASFGVASPGNFQRAAALTDAIATGLPLGIELTELGSQVSKVELKIGGIPLQFEEVGGDSREIVWQLGGGMVQSSEIRIFRKIDGGSEEVIWRHTKPGPWSLFRLLDQATPGKGDRKNEFKAKFNPGPGQATFVISFPEERDPFNGGGLWSVKCPQTL